MVPHSCRPACLRRLSGLVVLLGALCGGAASVAAQATFPPAGPDVLLSPNINLLDPEFNFRRRMLTWVDLSTGSIWVGGYDYATGNLVPADGKGTLIEAAVAAGPLNPALGFTRNGPEWALGDTTDYVVYTRTNAPGDPTPDNSQIGTASMSANGKWTRRTLPPLRRNGPYGSRSRDASAKISYQDGNGKHYVRTITDAASEVALPGLQRAGISPVVRFADTANIVSYPLTIDGVKQVVAYNIDTAVLSQLTFDAGAKDQNWLYSAPEIGGNLALTALVDGGTLIASYVPTVDSQGQTTYTRIAGIQAPGGGSWFSLEPFVYQGRSYALAQLTPPGVAYPTSVWLMSLDASTSVLRQVTPNGLPTETRADAEIVPLATGAMVVYSKFDNTKCPDGTDGSWLCLPGAMGLFRADSGLPPPPPR